MHQVLLNLGHTCYSNFHEVRTEASLIVWANVLGVETKGNANKGFVTVRILIG